LLLQQLLNSVCQGLARLGRVAFWDQSHVNSYEEFVFEVSAEELVNYEIWGEFWTCNNAPIEGEWQVTFPVEKNE